MIQPAALHPTRWHPSLLIAGNVTTKHKSDWSTCLSHVQHGGLASQQYFIVIFTRDIYKVLARNTFSYCALVIRKLKYNRSIYREGTYSVKSLKQEAHVKMRY